MSQTYKISGSVIETTVGDEVVILHLDSGQYYGMDGVSARIWELLRDGSAPEVISETLHREFEADLPTIEGDVAEFLHQLREEKFIEAA